MNFSKTLLSLLIFISIAVVFNACVKDQEGFPTQSFVPFNPEELITTTIFGVVVDENDIPVYNGEVSLKVGDSFVTSYTNQKGDFGFRDVEVPREGAFLKVRSEGKFEAFRKMNVSDNSYSQTKIKLLDKTIVGSISAMSGGTVNHSSSAKLELPANGVRHENGDAYTGNVEVAMSWIDPTAEDLTLRMIGDLSGRDKDGKVVSLGTFGMLNVELFGENGEELQLQEGNPATLTFPVPVEILGQAPSTIPLWYYDEDLGTWVEDGEATLQGDSYIGEVTHFSSWNVDWKGERIAVKGQVLLRSDNEDSGVPYLQIFVHTEGVLLGGGFLDNEGEFLFYNFPANRTFLLSILDPCGGIIWEEELGPYGIDTDLGNIVLEGTDIPSVVIKGRARDCNGAILTNAYVQIELDGITQTHSIEEDGTFEIVTNFCKDEFGIIEVIDVSNKKSMLQSFNINETSKQIELGTLSACEDILYYFELKIDGQDSLFLPNPYISVPSPSVPQSDEYLTIYAKNLGIGDDYANAQFTIRYVEGVGSYQPDYFYWHLRSEVFNSLDRYSLAPEVTTIELTQYGDNLGDVIEGTFIGEDIVGPDSSGLEGTASGSFRAIRK